MFITKLSSLFLLLSFILVVSCSHQLAQERSVANQHELTCTDSIKGEYQSYFDSAQKCIEKEYHK